MGLYVIVMWEAQKRNIRKDIRREEWRKKLNNARGEGETLRGEGRREKRERERGR